MPNPPPSLDFNFLTNSLFSSFLENVIVINIVWPSGHEDPSETLEQKCIQFSIVLQASYWFSMFCNHSTDLTSVLKILSFVFIEYTFEFQICFSLIKEVIALWILFVISSSPPPMMLTFAPKYVYLSTVLQCELDCWSCCWFSWLLFSSYLFSDPEEFWSPTHKALFGNRLNFSAKSP